MVYDSLWYSFDFKMIMSNKILQNLIKKYRFA